MSDAQWSVQRAPRRTSGLGGTSAGAMDGAASPAASGPDDKAEPHPRACGCGCGCGRRWSWRQEARVLGAEGLGTALLVLLGGVGAAHGAGGAAAGAVVGMLVQCFDHISGAMLNPCVTAAGAVWGRVGGARAAGLAGAQVAGGAAGAAVLRALAGERAAAAAVTRPAPHVPPWAAAALEAAGGACLALANCAAWDPRTLHLRDSWPLRIGLTVAALSLVLGELTGASFNPARSFGPALVAGAWDHHWVYWVGPLGGAVGAAVLYVSVWRPPAPRPLLPAHTAR